MARRACWRTGTARRRRRGRGPSSAPASRAGAAATSTRPKRGCGSTWPSAGRESTGRTRPPPCTRWGSWPRSGGTTPGPRPSARRRSPGARAAGATRAVAWALSLLRRQALRRGDLERAAALGQEALARFRELGDAGAASNALAAAGHLARRRGDPAGAAADYAESLALFRDLGSRHGVATRLVDLGHAALEQGDRARAVERFAEGASRHRDVGDGQGVAAALTGLARVAAAAGRPAAAAQLLAAARTALGAGAARLDRITEELYDGTLAAARAALREPAFGAAWGEGLAWSPEQAVAVARRALAGAWMVRERSSSGRHTGIGPRRRDSQIARATSSASRP